MLSEYGGRIAFGDGLIEGVGDCAGFALAGYHREKVGCGQQRGDGDREGLLGDFVERGEAAVVDLLLAAIRVEGDDLYGFGVAEIRHGGIVKRQVVILADAEADDIRGEGFQQNGIAEAFGGRIVGQAVDEVHGLEGQMVEEVGFQVIAEGLGLVGAETEVFVHVKGIDPIPFEGLLPEVCEEFVL